MGEAFVRVSPEGAGFASKLQAQLKGAGLANVGVLAGAAIAGGIVVALSSIGAEFGKARRIITQETGASAKDIEGLFRTVRRSVLEVPVSLEAAAKAVDLLFKRGVPLGPQLDKLAKQELFLAKITGTDLASNVEQTTAIFAKFNVPLREQSKELDVLFKAQQKSGKGLDDLLQPLQTGGAALQEFGFSLDQSAALITNLQIAGVNVQPALAALRKAFGQLAKEGKDPQKALADLVAEFKSGKDPAKAMADAMKLFGSRAGLELARAIRAGKFAVGDLLKIITDGKGGIIATGLATLTLGDRFKLLRAKIEESVADIAIKVRTALVHVVVALSDPVERIAAAFVHLGVAVAPLLVLLTPIGLAFRLILPALGAFATGLDAIATVLGPVLSNPIGIAVAGLAALTTAFAFSALGSHALAFAIRDLTISLLTNPYVATAAAIVGIGVAIQTFRERSDPAIQVAKNFSAAMAETDSATTIFKGGVDTATRALHDLFEAQVRSSDKGFVKAILAGTGQTVDQLTTAVSGSATAWDQYVASSVAALRVSGASELEIAGLVEQLAALRPAFAIYASAQATSAIQTGVLSRAQKNAIVEQNRFKDGSVNLAGVLDDINVKLRRSVDSHNAAALASKSVKDAEADLAQQLAEGTLSASDLTVALTGLGFAGEEVQRQAARLTLQAQVLTETQDAQALSTISTSSAYGELARNLATGKTSIASATLALEDLGLSATGAAAEAGNLDSAIKSFVDGAIAQLPTVGSAIDDFQKGITEAGSTLADDKKKQVELNQRLNDALASSSAKFGQQLASINLTIQQDQAKIAAGSTTTTDKLQRDLLRRSQIIAGSGSASASLRDEVIKNNAAIRADYANLAASKDPNRFTQGLIANAVKIATFTANLKKLFGLGLGALAGELAKKGPDAAAELTAQFASNPAKAAIAAKGAELGQAASDGLRKLLEKNAPEALGLGAKQGLTIGKAIADGITRELLANFPQLRALGITTGDVINEGTKTGAASTDVTTGIDEHIRRAEGRFRDLSVPLGTKINEGVKAGAATGDVTSGIAASVAHGGGKLREAGVGLGTEAGAGIVAGILSQFKPVGDAVLAITQHGVAVARGSWRITSPSKVFAEIGSQVGKGLAVGISGSVADVGEAAALLASRTTASVDDALVGVETFKPLIQPDIRPKVAPIDVPPLADIAVRVAPTVTPVAPIELTGAFGPIPTPTIPTVTIPGTVTATVPPFDPVSLSGVLAPVDPPTFDPLRLAAFLGPVAEPTFNPIVFDASLGPVLPPVLDPVTLQTNLAPIDIPTLPALDATLNVARPNISPVVVPASLGSVRPPTVPNVTLSGSFAPVTPPTFDPIPLAGRLGPVLPPTFDPLVLAAHVDATLAPLQIPDLAPIPASLDLAKPVVPSVVVPSALAPFPVPRVSPVVAPLVIPPLPPLPVTTQVAPIVLPPIPRPAIEITPTLAPLPPLELAAAVNPPVVPQPPPLALDATVSAALPTFDPVVLSGTFGRVAPPLVPPAQIDATVKAALPQFPQVSLSGVIAPPAPPVLDPLALSVLPLTVPAVPPLPPIPASLAVSPPVVDPIVTTFAPIVPPVIPALAATVDITQFKQELNQRLGETISEWHRRLEELFSQHSGETINEWHRRLADEFGKSFARMVNDTTELRRWLLALAGAKVAPSIDLTKFDQTIQRSTVTASQRFSEWITRLNQLVPQRSGEALNEWSKRIGDFFGQRSGETISEWHRRLKDLVGDFHKSFGQIGDDATELRRFLLALGGTKFAPLEPPSKITIEQARQSLPVAAPQLRADAQRQQKEVRNVGLFDGATLNFPEKIDPLHIASEIVWRLL